MNQFNVTFKRVEAFYQTVTIQALTLEEAQQKADELSNEGMIEYDYFAESNILDEHILEVEKID